LKENKLGLTVFCDGGARGNPGPAAIGFLIKDKRGRILMQKGKYIGRATNNVAEYQAVVHALKWLINHQLSIINHQSLTINFYLDSQLAVKQLNGLFKIKNSQLRNLVVQIRGLENQIKGEIFYHHIPREKNVEADRFLNQALDNFLSLVGETG
jgi:ribonuclease HI